METKTKIELSDLQGRGGSAFTLCGKTESSYEFILAAGTSRNEQFDDFYKVIVDKQSDALSLEKLKITEIDGFGGRHSLSAATWNGKTVIFGGMDVMETRIFNELYAYHHDKNELEQIEYLKEGVIIPKPRNSHSFIQSGNKAYIYGGANEEGPLNDAFELDLEYMTFKKLKVDDNAPFFEMHTSHLLRNEKLLLVGGRSHCLPTQIADPKAQQEVMSSPFRDMIMQLDLNTGNVEEFANLPTGLAAHASFLLDDKYLLIYGGTNGLKFFDNVIRYDIEKKEWRLLTKYPES